MTSKQLSVSLVDLNQQGANALLAVVFEFLRQNNVSAKSINDFASRYLTAKKKSNGLRHYRQLVKFYDDMGVILATWFSDPKFLDDSGRPRPLSHRGGASSLAQLIRVSGASIETSTAIELMKQSPSFRLSANGLFYALRRVYVLPRFEVPRAAFIVERCLNTLQQNILRRQGQTPLLLERCSYVSEADLSTIAPMLRDIDSRGTAFMDSIDGEIERLRLRRSKGKRVGEVGVMVFAWTKPKTVGVCRK